MPMDASRRLNWRQCRWAFIPIKRIKKYLFIPFLTFIGQPIRAPLIYLKRIYDCDLFGEILQVFHIEEIVDTGKDTSYETFYYFKGSKISFEYNGINFQEIDGDDVYHSFSEEDLRQMTPLTKEEYEYYKSKFESIREQLKNINNYENI